MINDNHVLIVTGMDRSGTSWVAGAMRASGVFMGEQLYKAGRGNKFGHFEDEDFLRFHVRLLQDSDLEGLYRYSLADSLPAEIPISDGYVQKALQLIEHRNKHRLWGFKNPRAVLFLDFWKQLIPDVKIVCLYRHPLETCMSLFNRGDGFPDLGGVFRAFQHRMGHALDFKKRYPQQILLCNIHQIIIDPGLLQQKITNLFDISLKGLNTNLKQSFVPQAFSGISASLATLTKFYQLYPDAAYLFEQLEQEADIPGHEETQQLTEFCSRDSKTNPPPESEHKDPAHPNLELFYSLVEDSLQAESTRKKIIEGLLENVKIIGRVQEDHKKLHRKISSLSAEQNNLSVERDRLSTEINGLARERDSLNKQIQNYEHRLQSLDLMTRHLISLILTNMRAISQDPAKIKEKFRRWIDYRFRGKKLEFDREIPADTSANLVSSSTDDIS
ncbi:MAG: sulfotransferase [Anaerolineae bacterium]|nr:sulfotransferase [Anaerolineae bacterium]